MLTRQAVASEIDRVLFDRDARSLKSYAQDMLSAGEEWEPGAENVLGDALHALAEWGEPNWPLTEEDVWEIGNILKTVTDPDEAWSQLRLQFEDPRFLERRRLPIRRV